jgi:hypothetical protein
VSYEVPENGRNEEREGLPGASASFHDIKNMGKEKRLP